ncbi:MAG: DNA polymerase III subunit alpha [Gammaproteobacteria bacterium]|nr:DNA polymerase III subunit alpha [Gammaproteobacteria bacterium]
MIITSQNLSDIDAMNQFVHLHLHSEYSVKDSVLRIPALFKKARDLGFPAVAVSDANNLFATIKFYTEAIKYGIKPIIGCELSIGTDTASPPTDQCVALCLNEKGYRNLSRLVSTAYLKEDGSKWPMVSREDIAEHNEGLLILSGALRGSLGQALLRDDAKQVDLLLDFWTSVFKDRFYIELQYTQRPDEQNYVAQAIKLAKRTALPADASNDVCFLAKEDFDAHEIKVCIAEGRTLKDKHRRRDIYSREQYLKSADEMIALFKDVPSAIQNSVEIAKRCTVKLQLEQNHLPSFPIADGTSAAEKLRADAEVGLQNYLDSKAGLDAAAYRERLEMELKVICKMTYEGYFLIVADFIMWAKNHDIPVGPGRGSGSGSLVAYALGITEIDPLQYGLLFERFLNPDRVSLPDFDIDFCIEGRDRVIQYVADRYGRDKVGQIITFGSLGAKAAVRDVTRVLGFAYGLGDDIVKLIPSVLNIKLRDALEESSELKKRYDDDEKAKRIYDRALDLEGLVRNVSQHAAGIVIAPSPLTDYTALYKEADHHNAATHFDMKDIEKVGLVKFDFLGLEALTIINKTLENIKRHHDSVPELTQIPLNDAKTYRLLQSGATTAVFQLESDGMRRLIKNLKPDKFEDIVALLALYRPGPLKASMDKEYVNRKHGEKFEYEHPILEPILSTTYGVILYQEQVMQIAQALAGYTLGSADLLRRAMGKKIAEEMAAQRAVFIDGAIKNNVDRATATGLFDLIEHFAGYGFNRAHSVAYALIAYQTAWLKSNYSGAFMAAVLTSEISDTDKIIDLSDECRNLGLTIIPPDINRSQYEFTEIEGGKILYGLGAIRQVGREMVKTIIDEREARGAYQSLADFCQRLVAKIRSNMIEPLIATGSFDEIEPDRGAALQSLEDVYALAEQESRDSKSGQTNIFGDEAAPQIAPKSMHESTPTMTREQLLAKEKNSLGFYLTANPVTEYRDKLRHIVSYKTLKDFKRSVETSQNAPREAWLAGVINKPEEKVIYKKQSSQNEQQTEKPRATKGMAMAFFMLDDGTGSLNLSLFGKHYENYRDKLSHEGVVVVGVYRAANHWRASQIMTVEEAQKSFAKDLNVVWDIGNLGNGHQVNNLVDELNSALQPFIKPSGGCKVYISFRNTNAETRMILSESCKVEPCEQLFERIKGIPGVQDVTVKYRPTY